MQNSNKTSVLGCSSTNFFLSYLKGLLGIGEEARAAFNQDQDLYSTFVPKKPPIVDSTMSKRNQTSRKEPTISKQSSLVTIFAVWNTMMGTSLLAMPWGMERAGLVAGPFLMIVQGGVCLFTAYLNLRTESHLGSPTWEISELTRALLGPVAEVIAKIFSFVVLLGANIVYWILMSNFLYFTINFITGVREDVILSDTVVSSVNSSLAGALCPLFKEEIMNESLKEISLYQRIWDLQNTVPIFLVLIIGPLLNFKSPTFFTKFNSLGTLSVMYIILFVIIKSSFWGINIDLKDVTSIHYTPLIKGSFPAMSGMLALSYFIHNIIITLMRSNANQKNNGRDLTIAYILVMLTYLSIGVVFFLGFPLGKSCIQDNLLNNFATWDIMTVAARAFLLFQLMTVFPLISYMLRVQTMVALVGNPYPSRGHILLFNAFVITVCVLFAVFLPKIGTIIRFTGALSGLVHVFAIPCLLRLATLKKSGKISTPSYTMYILIIIYGAANLIGQFFVKDR
ncbi:unnamed protein product [Nezara viridula]|uniref:Amino acid transporter transmembrane domain-containing protein n=1 Tax=Nezara viridula TaxID=85310 RepID=A0A9P0E7B6_NEZVI|nr:unnamed protein product [Nezara viridula]